MTRNHTDDTNTSETETETDSDPDHERESERERDLTDAEREHVARLKALREGGTHNMFTHLRTGLEAHFGDAGTETYEWVVDNFDYYRSGEWVDRDVSATPDPDPDADPDDDEGDEGDARTDGGPTLVTDGGRDIGRRGFLGAAAAVGVTALAGCSGDSGGDGGDGGDEYEDGNGSPESENEGESESEGNEGGGESGDANASEGESEGENETDPANAEQGENVEQHAGLELLEHEVVEEEFSTSIEGVVANNSGERKDYVEVRARTYNADGQQLNSLMTNTTDLDDGVEWAFTIHVIETEDFDSYDIQVNDDVF